MSADTTKAMEEALQAAVARMNTTTAEPHAAPMDPMGALLSVLPKLMHQDDSGEELIEKLDALQKSDLVPLREQVLTLRKQCFRLLKGQERLLATVQEIQKQQAAVAGAVLDLARQMARITFVEDDYAGGDDYEPEAPPGMYGRAELRMSRDGRGRRAARD